MNYVVTVWMIVCIENVIIGVRRNRMMVQDQVQVTMRRTQRDTMRPVTHRHQRERPRDLARTPYREQKEHHERLKAAHYPIDTLRLDGFQPLSRQPRRGTKRPTRAA